MSGVRQVLFIGYEIVTLVVIITKVDNSFIITLAVKTAQIQFINVQTTH